VALTEVDGFPVDAVVALRDRLSVTTAEEFVDLADRLGSSLAALLEVDKPTLEQWRALAAARVESAQPTADGEPAFPTGMDPPPEGRDTFGA